MPNATVRANAQALPEATKHPDAELFALAERCIVADNEAKATSEAFEQAMARCRNLATPPVIVRTGQDKALGLYVGNREGTAYTRADIPALRALVRANSIIDDSSRGETFQVWNRATEILDALRDLKEKEAREKVESGLAEAKGRDDEARDVYEELAWALAMTTAATTEGVLAKAHFMRNVFAAVDFGANLKDRLRRVGADDEVFAMSLARDLILLVKLEAAR